jgi:hypothetical protein
VIASPVFASLQEYNPTGLNGNVTGDWLTIVDAGPNPVF